MTQVTRLLDSHVPGLPGEQRKDLFGVLEQRVEALAERHRESMDRLEELRRQHRVLNPSHKVALTTVEGRVTTAADGDAAHEVLVIDKVIGLKPGTGC